MRLPEPTSKRQGKEPDVLFIIAADCATACACWAIDLAGGTRRAWGSGPADLANARGTGLASATDPGRAWVEEICLASLIARAWATALGRASGTGRAWAIDRASGTCRDPASESDPSLATDPSPSSATDPSLATAPALAPSSPAAENGPAPCRALWGIGLSERFLLRQTTANHRRDTCVPMNGPESATDGVPTAATRSDAAAAAAGSRRPA